MNPQPAVLETATLPIELLPFNSVCLVSNHTVKACLRTVEQGYRPAECTTQTARVPTRVRDLRDMRNNVPMTSASAFPRVSRRIGAIAESATLAVDAKAKALKAAGRPVVGFGAGEPDFPTPAYIVEVAKAACENPANHRYTPAAGLPEMKDAIVAKTLRDSGYAIDSSQVLVTNGGKQAVYQAFATIVDPGDEVLLPAPYWTTYPEAVALAGGVSVEVVADETQNYLVSVEQLEAARTPKTKVLLFCSPSNPTGSVYSCLLYTSPSPRDTERSRMPSSA